MNLTDIIQRYLPRYKASAHSTSADQWSALNAILGCRTGQYGDMALSCSDCPWQTICHQSCGHRSCNQCQHHSTTQWLERQSAKLLPVNYFMVTFTLPFELRGLAKANQKMLYRLLFKCAIATLQDFGLNDKSLNADLGMTAVLHTHSRRLDYHPHVHVIVPGGGMNKQRNEWRKKKGKYLFNGFALADVFRGKLLSAIADAGLTYHNTPNKWVVHCERVGRGLAALKYLSRYLYRGVISDKNILSDDGTHVTFQYKESASGEWKTRRCLGEDFIALIVQHTLPKGFRRARDYGFLHGNAKARLKRIQLLLRVILPYLEDKPRPSFICKLCSHPMTIIGFKRPNFASG